MRYVLPLAGVVLALSMAGAAQAADRDHGPRGHRDQAATQSQGPGWQNNNGPRRPPVFNKDHRPAPVVKDTRRNDDNWRGGNNWRSDNQWRDLRRNYQAPKRHRVGVYHGPRNFQYRRWSYGERLPSVYFSRPYWLLNAIVYGLVTPPPGLVWVRYGDDALLVDRYTGEIVQVRYNVFY